MKMAGRTEGRSKPGRSLAQQAPAFAWLAGCMLLLLHTAIWNARMHSGATSSAQALRAGGLPGSGPAPASAAAAAGGVRVPTGPVQLTARGRTLVVYVFGGSDPEYDESLRFFLHEAVKVGGRAAGSCSGARRGRGGHSTSAHVHPCRPAAAPY